MKKFFNPPPQNLSEQAEKRAEKASEGKMSEEKEQEQQKDVNDPDYDLSDVGDAPLLAVLKSKAEEGGDLSDESEKSEDPEDPKVSKDSNNLNDPKAPKDPKDSKDLKDGKDSEDLKDPASIEPDIRTSLRLINIVSKLLSGEIPEAEFEKLLDAAYAHEAIIKAREEGEIAGRNAIIEEKLRPVKTGAPDLTGSPAPKQNRAASIFDLARNAR